MRCSLAVDATVPIHSGRRSPIPRRETPRSVDRTLRGTPHAPRAPDRRPPESGAAPAPGGDAPAGAGVLARAAQRRDAPLHLGRGDAHSLLLHRPAVVPRHLLRGVLGPAHRAGPVSYTHLTLLTIYS